MNTLTQFFTSDISLWGLFISSFLAATLLPGGSEAVLIGVLKLHPELFWLSLLLGTIGNTLGGMVTFGMGRLLPPHKLKHVEQAQSHYGEEVPSDPGVTASHLLPQTAGFASNVSKVRRYGTPALLLAWVPLIGDALCLAAGWLRLNPWTAALFMALGKFARYWVIAIAIS